MGIGSIFLTVEVLMVVHDESLQSECVESSQDSIGGVY